MSHVVTPALEASTHGSAMHRVHFENGGVNTSAFPSILLTQGHIELKATLYMWSDSSEEERF